MKKPLATLFLILLCLPFLHAEELLDRVVAVVNDEVITQSEVDTFLRPLYEEYKDQYSGQELMKMLQDARRKLINQLIEDKLVYQEAMNRKIEVNEADIDKELAELKGRLEKPSELDLQLEREGMSVNDLREKLKKQIMIRRLQDMEVRAKVMVSPTEVENFYRENPDKFVTKDRVRVRSLTIKKSNEAREKGVTDEDAKALIDRLYRKVRKGDNFLELVENFSQDSHAKDKGAGEWIERGTMIESVDEAIFKTQVGKFTNIVETPLGYHVFRIEEREIGKKRNFEEVRDQIQMYLFREKSNLRFQEWAQELKRNAYISIRS